MNPDVIALIGTRTVYTDNLGQALDQIERDTQRRLDLCGVSIRRTKDGGLQVETDQSAKPSAQTNRVARWGGLTLAAVWAGREAAYSGDARAALAAGISAGLRFAALVTPDGGALEKAIRRRLNSEYGRRPRPGRLGPAARAVAAAVDCGYETVADIASFLSDHRELADAENDMDLGIDPGRSGGFWIKDFTRDTSGVLIPHDQRAEFDGEHYRIHVSETRIARLIGETKRRNARNR